MPKGFRSIECRTCGLVPGAKILQRWMVANTVGGALGAVLGTVTLIVSLKIANAPGIRGHEPMFTAAFLSIYALPAAVFAAMVSMAQRRVIARYHDVGGWWIGASAAGAGIGALLGFGLILLFTQSPVWGAIHAVFGSSPVSGGLLSVGIGLGLGIGQWWHLRGLRLASLWVAANLVGMVGGALSLGWTASLFGAHRPLPLVVAQGVVAWFGVSLVTGGTLVYLINRSRRVANVR